MGKRIKTLTSTPDEKAIAGKGHKEAKSALLGMRVSQLVEAFGNCTSPDAKKVVLEDGTVIIPTIKEEIVYNAMMRERDAPRGFQTVLDMQKALGEAKDEVSVSVSLVDEDLMKRALD